MKIKKLALAAIICGAAILGTNFTTAFAEPFTYDLQATQIETTETEQLSQKLCEQNKIILETVIVDNEKVTSSFPFK
ncbi:MAG: hypothetical protein IJT73_11895 [Selenomonadaceae bacterium]|nr:hypothetical protein [Selenomonadaceae bacterium]